MQRRTQKERSLWRSAGNEMSICYMIVEKPLPISKPLSISKIIVKLETCRKTQELLSPQETVRVGIDPVSPLHRIKISGSAIACYASCFTCTRKRSSINRFAGPLSRHLHPPPRNSPHHNYHHNVMMRRIMTYSIWSVFRWSRSEFMLARLCYNCMPAN
jgi:hypothetical protein